ncbi:helix-turn-helix domain-containing protein [Mycobacterium sp. Aquia_216]|uniref:helix-turn-helix domain-containing protein n=1 Tax=Mycobacterium sp. Aquia_216 TaxID=2991729 RepID=UPI00227D4AE5|nr:helix-turn-helix domain-containing protein [Mycobacterium sp. Aquia_216]WAJ44297.1 helix-turn-helix domain-containing protein [Mycobacterium sp. Aquia_216]
MTAVVLDTRQIPAADRAEVVTQVIHDTLVAVNIAFTEATPVVAAGTIHELGDLKNFSVQSNALTVERTPAQARDDLRPCVFLGLQRSGASMVVQHGREATLRPGELVLWESTAPYTVFDPEGIRHHFFRIPIDRLALPHEVIRQLCAVTLSPGHPVADLAFTYFRRLSTRLDVFDRPGADGVSQPSIELVRALATTHVDATELGKDSMHATLQLRIVEYLRAHLREPDLSAARVAAEHHISVRQLYKVLAAVDVTLGDWIRSERLEGCRRDIAQLGEHTASIASVARRWGFADPSSFARMYRTAYGMSPREWRHLSRIEAG